MDYVRLTGVVLKNLRPTNAKKITIIQAIPRNNSISAPSEWDTQREPLWLTQDVAVSVVHSTTTAHPMHMLPRKSLVTVSSPPPLPFGKPKSITVPQAKHLASELEMGVLHIEHTCNVKLSDNFSCETGSSFMASFSGSTSNAGLNEK